MESFNIDRLSPTKHHPRRPVSRADSDTPVSAWASAHSAVYQSPPSLPRPSHRERLNLSLRLWKAKIHNLSPQNRIPTVLCISVETLGTSGRYYVLPPSDAVSVGSCPSTGSRNVSTSVGSSVDNRGTAPPRIA